MITFGRNSFVLLTLLLGRIAFAGGSGVNVVVVVNQNSTNSVELGNYYCEKRGVPPQNVLRASWSGGNADWTRAEMDSVLRTPLLAMLASRQLSNQIDTVLLSMDFPYRVNENTGTASTSGRNGTTSALYYGFKVDGCDSGCPAGLPSCNLPAPSSNSYAGSERIFRQTPPINLTSNSWLTVMITASNLAQAKAIVDRGLAADGTAPSQPVYLAKTFDLVRSVRAVTFDDAVFDTRVAGVALVRATNTSTSAGLGPLAGFLTGVQWFAVPTNTFVPGAMADDLTSYGGDLFSSPDHTRVLDFINAGATASYGTVMEPCTYLEKFPSPRNYFYQSRGFSIAECYYQSVTNPYQGILVGEPLSAPFAHPGTGNWPGMPALDLVSGVPEFGVEFSAADAMHPLAQVDLFLDGALVQTLTNVLPKAGNRLLVTLPGKTNLSYTIPANADLVSIANSLAGILNSPANNIATKVDAYAHGDRLELRSNDPNRSGSQTWLAASSVQGTANELCTYVFAPAPNFLDTIAQGRREITIIGTLVVGDTLNLSVTKTNGAIVNISVTNTASATLGDFVQLFAAAINAAPALQGGDGLRAEDLLTGTAGAGIPAAQFNLRARSVGPRAAQIQAVVTGTFSISPIGSAALNENLADLQPRDHLYVASGRTNLDLTFLFDTRTLADGYHELAAVAYEGSHVRTQTRTTQKILIQNNGWSAMLTPLVGGSNCALEATLQFAVVATTNNISSIELFSTGGSLGLTNNVAGASFAVSAAYLGIGLHPFYSIVTRTDGSRYRTQTEWCRIRGAEPLFSVAVTEPLATLTWPASAGRNYQVLAATNLADGFTLQANVVPTNSLGRWFDPQGLSGARFYRVKTP